VTSAAQVATGAWNLLPKGVKGSRSKVVSLFTPTFSGEENAKQIKDVSSANFLSEEGQTSVGWIL
jgi:hypothetical protein